ncbi:MAG: SIS domain-containing protein [Candidatus Cybelea sp.]|jgi:D-sedoheptulose 7-phosphate isomerase
MLNATRNSAELAVWVAGAIRGRSPVAQRFFDSRGEEIARAARAVAQRLSAGGSIYAFGRGAYATDAAHVAVEFVHPVLVGKPALPASDVSLSFESCLPVIAGPKDVVVAFGPPGGDPAVDRALADARTSGAFTIALGGSHADFAVPAASDDEHVHQEIVEITGHMLYESVHVFLEHRHRDGDAGASAFLYPFLGGEQPSGDVVTASVAASIAQKAADAQALRERVASEESPAIADAVTAIAQELRAGGRLLLFGNGGSATDATDWALDCVSPPAGLDPVPALSLAAEPATITAIANDVGREFIFLRQLIAHVRERDVVIALSTSGGSLNVIAALEEARKRGNCTVALLGYDGGEIFRRRLADHAIVVRSDYIPRVQEAQATIYHAMRRAIGRLADA